MPLGNRWKHIGTALGLQSATLEVINSSHRNDTTEALSQVVSKWLAKTHNVERFGDTCWDTLVKAVAHGAGGGDRRVAEDIARQYPAEVPQSDVSPPQDQPPQSKIICSVFSLDLTSDILSEYNMNK